MLFCPRALRRALRCGNSRSLLVDLFFILLFILACSVVASHLHGDPPSRGNDIEDEVLAQPNMLQRVIHDDVVKVRRPPEAQLNQPTRRRMEHARMSSRGRKEIDGVSYPLLNSAGNFIPIRRIVHVDLKGGAWRMGFFNETFRMLKLLGATGILLEWEDMFPFSGRLAAAVNGDAYSREQVNQILEGARTNGLKVIPLVQTFGHLEWILKLEQFAHLREAAAYPQVICFSSDEAWQLLQEMIDEVMSVHAKFGMQFFHMGADEVFQIGYCNSTLEAMRRHGSKERAMLWHMARVAEHIKRNADMPVSVLAWHDMLVEVAEDDLRMYRLPDLIEPVLWSYAEDLSQYLSPGTWFALKPFGKVWGASAFKGADGPMRYSSNPIHYIRNNEAWTMQLTANYKDFDLIQGLVITGWSRYDHMAILCELFPVAVPALAMSLESVIEGRMMNAEYPKTSRLLRCTAPVDPGFVVGCQFPGARVYELINEFWSQHEQMRRYVDTDFDFNGWLSEFAIRRLYSSPMYVEKVLRFIEFYLTPMQRLRDELRIEMNKVFFNDTVNEFIETYVEKDVKLLEERRRLGTQIFEQRHFAKRPFVVKPSNGV
ncbi:Hexosaminidase D [Toxocara canis]|uniref:beta-N-acetylhexosaminidase n=1 Tax=Toxocara canis TaxID=6265 RepID=A0A0B2VH52_TOXCA|nr:Hexosaminidase D [Toxocara canis]